MEQLPIELLQMIVAQHVSSFEPFRALEALELRIVNRTFDALIRYNLFGINIFGPPAEWPSNIPSRKQARLLYEIVKASPKNHQGYPIQWVRAAMSIVLRYHHTHELPCSFRSQCGSKVQTVEDTILKAFCEFVLLGKRVYLRQSLNNDSLAPALTALTALGGGICQILQEMPKDWLNEGTIRYLLESIPCFDQEHTTKAWLDFVFQQCPNLLETFLKPSPTSARGISYGGLIRILTSAANNGHCRTVRGILASKDFMLCIEKNTYSEVILGTSRFLAKDVSVQRNMVKTLLSFTDPKDVPQRYQNILLDACMLGDDVLACSLLDTATWSPEILDTLLERAITHNRLSVVIKLKNCGVNLNSSSARLGSPLTQATKLRRSEIVDWLIQNGAMISSLHRGTFYDSLDDRDIYPLWQNHFIEHVIKIADILAINRALNPNESHDQWTLIAKAAKFGNVELIKLLISHGANPKRQRGGITPLLAAVANRNLDNAKGLVEYFLSIGLSPNGVKSKSKVSKTIGIKGKTCPGALACKMGRVKICELLRNKELIKQLKEASAT